MARTDGANWQLGMASNRCPRKVETERNTIFQLSSRKQVVRKRNETVKSERKKERSSMETGTPTRNGLHRRLSARLKCARFFNWNLCIFYYHLD